MVLHFSQESDKVNEQNERDHAECTKSEDVCVKGQSNACQTELAELKQKYVYLMSDFDNFKKRTAKDYENIRIDAYMRLLKPLLVVVDDFDRALEAQGAEVDEGLFLIRKSLDKLLEQFGVIQMEVSGTFDPERHEALLYVQVEGKAKDEIISVLQKGYIMNGIVIRPAKVSVAQ